jgi:predicted Zn-dependent protease with MMP-like domain
MKINPQSGRRPVHSAILLKPTISLEQTETQAIENHARAPRNDDAVRWAKNRMPISVFMEPPPREAFDSAVQLLHASLRQWEGALNTLDKGQGLCFQPLMELAEDQQPDIMIRWASHTTLGRDFEVGHTQRTVKEGVIVQGVIVLITHPMIDKQLGPQTQRQRLYATLLHEIGHAIGLEHSTNPADVMHHRGWQHTLLSQNDINRIRLLYKDF